MGVVLNFVWLLSVTILTFNIFALSIVLQPKSKRRIVRKRFIQRIKNLRSGPLVRSLSFSFDSYQYLITLPAQSFIRPLRALIGAGPSEETAANPWQTRTYQLFAVNGHSAGLFFFMFHFGGQSVIVLFPLLALFYGSYWLGMGAKTHFKMKIFEFLNDLSNMLMGVVFIALFFTALFDLSMAWRMPYCILMFFPLIHSGQLIIMAIVEELLPRTRIQSSMKAFDVSVLAGYYVFCVGFAISPLLSNFALFLGSNTPIAFSSANGSIVLFANAILDGVTFLVTYVLLKDADLTRPISTIARLLGDLTISAALSVMASVVIILGSFEAFDYEKTMNLALGVVAGEVALVNELVLLAHTAFLPVFLVCFFALALQLAQLLYVVSDTILTIFVSRQARLRDIITLSGVIAFFLASVSTGVLRMMA